jgi:hypothetical protein
LEIEQALRKTYSKITHLQELVAALNTKKASARAQTPSAKNEHRRLIAAAMSFPYFVSIECAATRAHSSADQGALLSTSKTTDAGACDGRPGNC